MWRHAALLIAAAGIIAGCGHDKTPPKLKPTPEVVRTQYGLNPGSCWRYKQLGTGLLERIDITGPNTTAIAGKSAFVRVTTQDAGGNPVQEFFDVNTDSEVRLLRWSQGNDVKRYDADMVQPLFARFQFNTKNEPVLKNGDRFEVTSTPKDLAAEMHEWVVQNDMAMAMTPDGMKTAYQLQYRINGAMTRQYFLVPGFGVASFTDALGVTHQVCAARVCDDTGACTGAASCSELVCN